MFLNFMNLKRDFNLFCIEFILQSLFSFLYICINIKYIVFILYITIYITVYTFLLTKKKAIFLFQINLVIMCILKR